MAGGTGQAMPFASAGATDSIPEMAPLAFDQIIIAGGDEDVTAVELFEWVAPLLAGIPGGRWMSCQIDIAETGEVLAHYRHGASDTAVFITLDPQAPMTRDLLQQLPAAQSVTMILLSDYSSQAVMLLDCVARWLNIYDIDDDSLAPMLRLLGGFQSILAKAA
jgi:hypothetical protein